MKKLTDEEIFNIEKKLEEKNITFDLLISEFERLEGLEDDLTCAYIIGIENFKSKIREKIKEEEKFLETLNKAKDIERIKATNERIFAYKSLLGG